MEETQKLVIMENINWLCENQHYEDEIVSSFLSHNILTDSETELIMSRKNRIDKNSSFYYSIITKRDSFPILLSTLRKTNNEKIASYLERKIEEKVAIKRSLIGPNLERFLIPHLSRLCEETHNTNNLAKQLMNQGLINALEAKYIVDHPDVFYRNAELYKVITRKVITYDDMMKILRITGNSEVAEYLDSLAV